MANSRNEEILTAMIDGSGSQDLKEPQSREEALLQGVLRKLDNIEPDPEVIAQAVDDWLDDHPEATTTVEDGAITYAKLNSDLQETVDDVGELKTEVKSLDAYDKEELRWVQGGINTANGNGGSSTTFIRDMTGYSSAQYTYIECGNSYAIGIFAYDNSDTFVGVLKNDGSFATGATNQKFVTKFSLADYPAYTFKIVLKNQDDSAITPSSGYSNCYLLRNKISALDAIINIPDEMTWDKCDGNYIKTNVTTIDTSSPYTSSSSYHGYCTFMQCSPGDVFIVSTKADANLRPYVFCSSNGTVIALGDNVQYHNERVVAPTNSAYVGFNSSASDEYRTVLIGETAIGKLSCELDDIEDALGEINETIGTTEQMAWAYTDKKYIATNGTSIDTSSPYSNSNSYHGKASFIECEPGDVFVVTLSATGNNFRPYVFCSSDGTILFRSENVAFTNERIVAPASAAYVGFNSDSTGAVQIGETIFERYDYEIGQVEKLVDSPFKGMSCVAFGTSLTYRDLGYRPYLAEILGMTIDNQGVGSSHWQWWQENTSNILYNVQQYQNYSDKDVCIIEGCVNDWGGERTLGTYKDTGTDTVCGCLYNMISHVYTQNPNIQIFVILDHFGRIYNSTDTSSAALNDNNQTQRDYYEECAKLCEFYGIPCIKEYAISSIGEFGTQYLYDNIHLNALGGQQSAMVIAKAMMQYGRKITAN